MIFIHYLCDVNFDKEFLINHWSKFTFFIRMAKILRSSHRRCSVRKGILRKFARLTQENTCARVSILIKFQAETRNFLKKETLVQVLSCDFAKFLRTHFWQDTSRRLLLDTVKFRSQQWKWKVFWRAILRGYLSFKCTFLPDFDAVQFRMVLSPWNWRDKVKTCQMS